MDAHLKAAVPSGRAINPITDTNWERCWDHPDIETPAEPAFDKAYESALGHVVGLSDKGTRRGAAEEAQKAPADLG